MVLEGSEVWLVLYSHWGTVGMFLVCSAVFGADSLCDIQMRVRIRFFPPYLVLMLWLYVICDKSLYTKVEEPEVD